MSLRYLINPLTIRRLPTLLLPIHQRCLATKTEQPAPEVGPTAVPELQLNNLTGDHQRTKASVRWRFFIRFFV